MTCGYAEHFANAGGDDSRPIYLELGWLLPVGTWISSPLRTRLRGLGGFLFILGGAGSSG